jgi:hypothetical protein
MMDDTMEREATCYEKAKANGEPTFTLRAQDISAHLCVEFWVAAQRAIRDLMDAGATMTEAVESVREYHKVPRLVMMGESMTVKDREALGIARAMMGFQGVRKLAD